MLISLAVANFKSFDKLTEFNMIASKKLRENKERIYYNENVSILKSAVIYGANASGKSNLIDAFEFVKQCVLSSKGIPIQAQQLFCKNNETNENKITTFEIKLCINDTCYAYGFDTLLKDRTIKAEWIINLTAANKPVVLFERKNDIFTIGDIELDNIDLSKLETYIDDMKDNENILFLSEMNRNKRINKNSELMFFKDIFNWFNTNMNIFHPDTPVTDFEYYYDEASLEVVKKLIHNFDMGIIDIKIKELPLDELRNKVPKYVLDTIFERFESNKKIDKELKVSMRLKDNFFNVVLKDNEEPIITTLCFNHEKSVYDFGFAEESEGTRRIFELLDILLSVNKNNVYIIDEMERSLHPLLTKHFIQLVNKYHLNNNFQLIFTTHEATIMTQELFRRDQIWFVTKDNNNCSNLYPLDMFNERYDKKINKAYLEGRYGAIPIFKEYDYEGLDDGTN